MWTLWPEPCAACGRMGRLLCARCRPLRLSVGVDPVEGLAGVWAAAPYSGPLGVAVRRAKYRPDRRLTVELGGLLGRLCAADPQVAGADVVVPAPSGPWSRARRGFAPSALIADEVARALGVPCVDALRSTAVRRNSGLDVDGRRQNLRGRVGVARPVRGRVLWVDDVVTTGATAELCARLLLEHGAEQILAAAVCRAAGRSRTGVQIP